MIEKSENIIITGFSFTGKSVVGKEVAWRLRWNFIDSDEEIVALAGKSIPDIFAQDGEGHFRKLERQVLEKVCKGKGSVISTGGGAVVDWRNREFFSHNGVVICLEARPQTIYKRLNAAQETSTVVRPLLAVDDPLGQITRLKAARQPYYATADRSVYTDNLSVDEVADEVIHGFRQVSHRKSVASYHKSTPFVVTTPTQGYPVFVGWGILDDLGRRMRQLGLSDCASIISDENVFPRHGSPASASLEQADFKAASFSVLPGEKTKTFNTAMKLYDWLVERQTERVHAIVALGGGMVGDLAGFVAATFLRGLPLVQVPTSLIAMADAAIGGKVAVNHPRAKNLIGAFYQPSLVIADVSTLTTLPERELVSGWAEVIKHGVIFDGERLDFLQAHVSELLSLEAAPTIEAIQRSAMLKATVVGEDEKEQERRMILNYGHTIAHGLEVATGYERLLHGEAVAIGMMGAAMLSERLGLISHDIVARQANLLEGFRLPTYCSDVDKNEVVQAMALDKKVRERAIKWVLLEGIGQTTIRDDVPQEYVVGVLNELLT